MRPSATCVCGLKLLVYAAGGLDADNKVSDVVEVFDALPGVYVC